MEEEKLDAFLVTNMKNIRYLSGFTGDTGKLLITHNHKYLIVDGRFLEQAAKETNVEVIDYDKSFSKTIKRLCDENNAKKCAFESNDVTFGEYDALKKVMDSIELVPDNTTIENIRLVKDEGEIKLIKHALKIALETFEEIKTKIVPGVTEREISAEIEYMMKLKGAEGVAFETIVASGKRSSLPHGTATDKKIEYGDAVVIDMGALYNGYNSDITRTIFVGDMSKEQERIYEIVEKAQKKGIEAIKVGEKSSVPHNLVVEEFAKDNLDEYFVHSLGHGVGIDVHERPFLSPRGADTFQSGMIVTVEPGIYLPDKFGVRIEDMIMIE
ncbi:MAG: aminopeptidase P family protein [Clostridia bacterium]|nr:aminopeptidase P family protein [Clostridia bacterium]